MESITLITNKIRKHNLKCLKCNCKGNIQIINNNNNNNNNIEEKKEEQQKKEEEKKDKEEEKQKNSYSIIKSDECQCNNCDCIFFNIKNCLYCNNLYILSIKEQNIIGNEEEIIFKCPNNCQNKEYKRNITNVNATIPPWNRTLLHSAIQICDVELTWNLLLKEANPFLKDYRGVTPIDLAYNILQTLNKTSKLTGNKNETQRLLKRINQIISILPPQSQSQSSSSSSISSIKNISEFPSLPSVNRVVSEGTGKQTTLLNTDINNNYNYNKSVFNLNLPLPPNAARSVTDGVVHHEFRQSDVKKLESNLSKGIQMFTPLTLVRLTSEADGISTSISSLTITTKITEQKDDENNNNNNNHNEQNNEQNNEQKQEEKEEEEVEIDGGIMSLFDDIVEFLPANDDVNDNNIYKKFIETKNNVIDKVSTDSTELLDWKLSELKKAIAQENDVEEIIEFNTGTYVCSACMDEFPAVMLGYTCRTLGCSGVLCVECFTQLAYVIISSALYAVPVLRCPGGCFCRIPTKVWKTVLTKQPATGVIYDMRADCNMTDVGSILYEKYSENAEALMKLRCGCCHTTCPLFLSENNGDIIPINFDERMESIEDIIEPLEKVDQLIFFRTWLLFNKGKISTDLFTTTIYDLFADKNLSDDERELCENGVYSPLERFITPILLLFCDLERRLCSQLGFFRKFPKIQTRCCSENHCFMCKVYGHHEGSTCEEIQANEIGIDAQFCPACGVPTLRTEGCTHIVCVCGQEWEWEGNEYY